MIGLANGALLGPLTVSGLVSVAHYLGGTLGLAVLVVFASASSQLMDAKHRLAHQISAALTVSIVMLAIALLVTLTLVMSPAERKSN